MNLVVNTLERLMNSLPERCKVIIQATGFLPQIWRIYKTRRC